VVATLRDTMTPAGVVPLCLVCRAAGHMTDQGAPASAPRLTPEVTHRLEAFRVQLHDWRTTGRIGAPLFGLPGVTILADHCLSCGSPLIAGRTYRCAFCVQAIEAVLEMPPVLGLTDEGRP
jgi:hypothetical protein